MPPLATFPCSAVDVAMLNELGRDPGFPAIGVDPMRSAGDLARRIGASRNTVHTHLRTWRRQGFLRRFVTVPHPELFEQRLTGVLLSVAGLAARQRLEQALEFVGEVFVYAEVAPFSWIVFREDGFAPPRRWTRFLEIVDGVTLESPFLPVTLPPPGRVPGGFEWRLLAELRASPAPRARGLARALGVSHRTVTRHYRALLEANTFLAYPVLDFARLSGAFAILVAAVAAGAPAVALSETIARAGCVEVLPPPTLPRLDGSRETARADGSRLVSIAVYASSASTIAEAQRHVRSVPGVRSVRIGYPSQPVVLPQCFDRLLARQLGPHRGWLSPGGAGGRRPAVTGEGAPIPRSRRRRTARA
jgi:DNA-binding Lrp family transcriptional regulator